MIFRLPTIFLDFDGVLHTMGNTGYKPFHQLGLLERELASVTCDFQVVVSSSWRFHYSLEELRGQLGTLSGRVTGVTPEIRPCSYQRYHEIKEVVDTYRLERWIAVDDADWQFPPNCEHLIRCDPKSGLQPEHTGDVLAWLMQAP